MLTGTASPVVGLVPELQKFPARSKSVGTFPVKKFAVLPWPTFTLRKKNVLSRPSYRCGMRSGPPRLPPNRLLSDESLGCSCPLACQVRALKAESRRDLLEVG